MMKKDFKKRENIKKILIIALTIIVIVVLANFFERQIRSFFYFLSAPIQRTFWAAGDRTSDFFGMFIGIKKTKEENEKLRQGNQQLLYQGALLEETKKENEFLRQALELELKKEYNLLFAQIIGKDISRDVLTINKGKNDGVVKNMPVITASKALVGRIDEVYEGFSKVKLVSNEKVSFDAKILGKEISGLVRGEGKFKILFDLVSKEDDLQKEDVVTTSSLGGFFPSGLLVGKVKEIKKGDVEAFQKAEVESFFNIKETGFVFLILNY